MRNYFSFFYASIFFFLYNNAGFAPATLVFTAGGIFKQMKYLHSSDFLYGFDSNFQIVLRPIIALHSYEAPVVSCIEINKDELLICDPYQLFRLYSNYQWIRACDIETGCLLIDILWRPIKVTFSKIVNERTELYRYIIPPGAGQNSFIGRSRINVCNY